MDRYLNNKAGELPAAIRGAGSGTDLTIRRYAPEPAVDVPAQAFEPDDQEVRDVHRFRDWEDRAADDAGVRRWGEL